jgi:hypothetical protein
MAKPKDETTYYQQLHRDCGGEIVIVADGSTPPKVRMCCKTCQSFWAMQTPPYFAGVAIPADWISYEPKGEAKA